MTPLSAPPSPLTSWQRRLIWITFLLVAATRFYALSATMWDWDEALFAAGVQEFSVGWRPHPAGFPLYMLAAKIARPFVSSDFRACQAVVFVAACALFPLAFFLAREIRFPFATSYSAALLFVFLPNVWFYGGTGLSDIPGLAAWLAAVLLLLQGCRSARTFLIGAVVLGIAMGIRPQPFPMAAIPFALAAWVHLRQSWLRVVAAVAIVLAIVVACAVGSALASDSIESYRFAMKSHSGYVRGTDSFFNPDRPSLVKLSDDYFVHPLMDGRRLPYALSALAAAGLLVGLFRARWSVAMALSIFLPCALFAWLMVDLYSVHRFSTTYALLWGLLAAHAMSILTARVQIPLIALLAAACAWWTLPALQAVRNQAAPPTAAMQWTKKNVPPPQAVWIDGSLLPWAWYFLEGRKNVHIIRDRKELAAANTRDVFVAEGLMPGATAKFVYPRGRLWNIARHRWFETSVLPLSNVWLFGNGWYPDETDGALAWRWMGPRSEATLPAFAGRGRLSLTMGSSENLTPAVEVRFNDAVIGWFRATPQPARHEWIVESRADAPNRLVIVSSGVFNPSKMKISDDTRDLSVQLTSYSWQPVR